MRRRGLSGISKSTVSKLCKDIDDRVNAFLDRPLERFHADWKYPAWRSQFAHSAGFT